MANSIFKLAIYLAIPVAIIVYFNGTCTFLTSGGVLSALKDTINCVMLCNPNVNTTVKYCIPILKIKHAVLTKVCNMTPFGM